MIWRKDFIVQVYCPAVAHDSQAEVAKPAYATFASIINSACEKYSDR